MPRAATCPSCQHRLLVADTTSRWLTCPRCLASVGNPNVLLPTEPAAPSTPPDVVPAEPAPADLVCPQCDRPVERSWRICPFCAGPLRREPRRARASRLDAEVHRDSQAGTVGAGILAGLIVVGVAAFLFMGGPRLVSASPDGAAVLVVGTAVLGAVVIGCVAILVSSKSPTAKTVSGVLGGVFVGAGIVLMVVVLACLAVLAAFANFLNTCKCK